MMPIHAFPPSQAESTGDPRGAGRLGWPGQARGWIPAGGENTGPIPAATNVIEAEWREGLFQPLQAPARPAPAPPQHRSLDQVRAAAERWEMHGARQRHQVIPAGPAAAYVRIATGETPSLGLSVRV